MVVAMVSWCHGDVDGGWCVVNEGDGMAKVDCGGIVMVKVMFDMYGDGFNQGGWLIMGR